jgi:ribosomal protein S1
MSWTQRVRHPRDVLAPGDRVTVTILAIDTQKRTISCSLKDVDKDPWKDADTRFAPGTTHTATVSSQTKFGYFVDLTEGVTGLLSPRNIAQDHKGKIKAGDELQVKVISVDPPQRRIGLSLGIESADADDEFTRAYIKESTPKQTTPAKESSVSEFGAALLDALKKEKE